MNPKPKRPATARALRLRAALSALAERGINGEKANAQAKLARLLARYDFDTANQEQPTLFMGVFKLDSTARHVFTFEPGQEDWMSNVKWAIEHGCKIPCSLRGLELFAQCKPVTADRLAEITATITAGFGRLWEIFQGATGANPADRQTFLLGLYDGMMAETRVPGSRLPARAVICKTPSAKKKAVAPPAGFCVHPYTVAADLGKKLRFCVPLPEIEHELNNKLYPQLNP